MTGTTIADVRGWESDVLMPTPLTEELKIEVDKAFEKAGKQWEKEEIKGAPKKPKLGKESEFGNNSWLFNKLFSGDDSKLTKENKAFFDLKWNGTYYGMDKS